MNKNAQPAKILCLSFPRRRESISYNVFWIPAFARMTRSKTLPTTNHNLKAKKGFTLVELAIVIVIIGLLVGGVLQGQELIKQSRIQSAATQINGYVAAINTFKGKYNAWPGDFRQASTMISSSTGDGDGDGKIYSTITAIPPACFMSEVKAQASPAVDSELTYFWQHLSLSKMISFNFVKNTNYQVDMFPEFKLISKTFILPTCIDLSDTDGSGTNYGAVTGAGNIFILGSAVYRADASIQTNFGSTRVRYLIPSTASNTAPQASSAELYGLDKKLDDGAPNKGVIKVLAGCDYNLAAYTVSNDNCKSTLSYKWD
jgi:prepilin-type N-terminal cleavage/methylation domain-containing protein